MPSTRVHQAEHPKAENLDAAVVESPVAGGGIPVATATLTDYVELTKPRITILNMITTLAALWIAAAGRPGWGLALATLLGSALSVASGAVLNCWVERDRDLLMERTRDRALPAGRVPPANALIFGIVLGVAGVALLAMATTGAAAAIALGGIIFYAGIYTAWLKPTTHWNTVLGSISGSIPPLIGWTAVTGSLNLEGLAIAALVFIWQPVHFWALAMMYADDYRRAGIKMLPVTHGFAVTRRHILKWSIFLVAASLSIYFLDLAGTFYLVTALGFGAYILVQSVKNLRDTGIREATKLFHASNLYLALLFVLLIIDCGCHG